MDGKGLAEAAAMARETVMATAVAEYGSQQLRKVNSDSDGRRVAGGRVGTPQCESSG